MRNEPRETREKMDGRQARGNKAKLPSEQTRHRGQASVQESSRPLMSVQHSRVCLSVIAKVHFHSKLQHTAE